MEKNCLNCRYYYNHACNNKSVQFEELEYSNDGVTYIEDGILFANTEENLDLKQIASLIMEELNNKDMLKKKADLNKLNLDDMRTEVVEIVDSALCNSIQNYFSSNNKCKVGICNVEDFNCCYWE
jgi:hypothetical protein